MSGKIPVYAWYFPNWHVDARNEQWHGKGWTEWDVLLHAAKRFEGHQIDHPLWGYEDESDPRVMEKKIDAALSHGVDGFLWDFYWFNDDFGSGETAGSFRIKALDKGFFGAKNNEQFGIAVMLCYEHFFNGHPVKYYHPNDRILDGQLTPQAFYRATEYMIRHYFGRKNYIRVDGKIYFIIYHIRNFIESMGGTDGARAIIRDLRWRVREAGLGEMFIACVPGSFSTFNTPTGEGTAAAMKAIGIDGGVSYSWSNRRADTNTWPAFEYSEFVDNGIADFAVNTRKLEGMPMSITVSQGWDSSPRTVPSDKYDPIGYPYDWITAHKNPRDFERALRAAKAFFRSDASTGHFIALSTWNEWTEGNFLEPSVEEGFAYLDAVKRVFVDEE